MPSVKARRDYYRRHKAKCLERARIQRTKPGYHEMVRNCMLRKRYGITSHDYTRMLQEQGGVCAICGRDNPNNGKGNRYFDVDHDHKTGRVRGLLCRQCNAMLGHIEKDLLNKALSYLDQYRESPNL